MANKMDDRASDRILILALSLLGACINQSHVPAVGSFQSDGGVRCELPASGWMRDAYPTKGIFLSLGHPDEENEISPHISILEDRPRTKDELERYRNHALRTKRDGDPAKSEPIRDVTVDGRKGLLEDAIFLNALASIVHQRTTPAPPPVLTREQTIYVTGPARSYTIRYSAPISLFEKHHPEFEKLLASIKFAP
ncbi:MAG: hypothetical protein M0D55_10915 [Elusimicrobiota bacterium]|nr:MAG: hypothetical protein M0D55_10915 [Elusimicrobiota bacterium]